jgi:O-antigen/teichoic acid export membrane protein
LGSSIRRGTLWSVLNSVVGRVGQVVVGVVLARLLTPKDFGLFAVALVMYAVVVSVSELGVTIAIVRRPAEGAHLGPTVTTLSVLSGGALTALVWVCAPLIARSMLAPEATDVVRLLSFALLVAGVSAVPAAILQRDFRQDLRLLADTVNLLTSTLVAVGGALTGHGALALAGSRVAGNAASALVLYAVVQERYRPGWRPDVARNVLRSGLPLAGASLLSFAVLNVDYVVVGRTWGPAVLGVYVLAFNLSSLPVTVFSTVARSVALPAFSRLRSSPVGVARAYLQGLQLLFAASVLVSVLFAVLAEPLVTVVYGRVWEAAGLPLAFLAMLGTLRVMHELSYDYLVALGHSSFVLLVQAGWLVALCIALPLGAALGGLAGVGTAHLLVASLVILPAYTWVLARHGVRPGAAWRTIRRPTCAAVLTAAAAEAGRRSCSGAFAQLLTGGLAGTVVFLVAAAPVLPTTVRDRLRWSRLRPLTSENKEEPAWTTTP